MPRAALERLHGALAFLSRLAPPRQSFAPALLLPWFAPAGLLLGALFALPAWLLCRAGHATALPALAAWLWLVLEIWATRGLHWDGVADLGDATGSNATGEAFWTVLRDSRLGAFGALHLLLTFSGHMLALTLHMGADGWIFVLLAPCWSRASVVWLGSMAPAREASSLGGLTCAGVTPRLARAHVLLGILLALLPPALGMLPVWRALLLALGQYMLLASLARTARRHGGLSGDFFGACIQWSQLWFLLGTL